MEGKSSTVVQREDTVLKNVQLDYTLCIILQVSFFTTSCGHENGDKAEIISRGLSLEEKVSLNKNMQQAFKNQMPY